MLDSETFWYVCEDVTVRQTDRQNKDLFL